MMRVKLLDAMEEAERFLKKSRALMNESGDTMWEQTGNKLSGAVRRSSMDLTRALAELRKS